MSRKITKLEKEHSWWVTDHYDIDGIKYQKNPDDSFFFPSNLAPDDARIICQCESDRFILTYGSYEVFAECAACGAQQSVYSG